MTVLREVRSLYWKSLAHGLAQAREERSLTNPDLARLVAAWPVLPSHVKAAVLALVQTVTPPAGPLGGRQLTPRQIG